MFVVTNKLLEICGLFFCLNYGINILLLQSLNLFCEDGIWGFCKDLMLWICLILYAVMRRRKENLYWKDDLIVC